MKVSFDFKEIKSQKDFLNVLPLMQNLITEESNENVKPISKDKALIAWNKAKKTGYRIFAAVASSNEVIGVMGLSELNDPLEEKKSFRINNFIVENDFRGLGVGTEMMKRAEKIAKAEKAAFVLLEVLPTNKKAIRFYDKTLGYKYACNRMLKKVS